MDQPNFHPLFLSALEKANAGDYSGARADLEAYSREFPEDANALFYLGLVHAWAGDDESAFAAWGRCLEVDPEHERAFSELARLREVPEEDLDERDLDDSPRIEMAEIERDPRKTYPPEVWDEPAPVPVSAAGLFPRFAAWVVDSFLISMAMAPFWIPFYFILKDAGFLADQDSMFRFLQFAGYALLLIELPVYATYYYLSGQTPGKRLLGIRIVGCPDLDYLSLGQALVRYLGVAISSCVYMLGHLVALFNRERRTFHDFIAGTRVVASERLPWTRGELLLTLLLTVLGIVGLALTALVAIDMAEETMRQMKDPRRFFSG